MRSRDYLNKFKDKECALLSITETINTLKRVQSVNYNEAICWEITRQEKLYQALTKL